MADLMPVILVFETFEDRDAWAATRTEEMRIYQRNPWLAITLTKDELLTVVQPPVIGAFPDSQGDPCA